MATGAPRRYYSQRTGNNPQAELTLEMLGLLTLAVHGRLEAGDNFQEALGYHCIDAGFVPGTVGVDENAFVLLRLRKDNLWPINEYVDGYTEADLFDVIELLFDLVSLPGEGLYHGFDDCGMHYSTFDRLAGQEAFLSEMNPLLADYGVGFELSSDGEILTLAPAGMERLLEQAVPDVGAPDAPSRIDAATRKFRRRDASDSDKRGAVRDLADVLEYVRPKVKEFLVKKDESDLFQLANGFTVRHFNDGQKGDYDQGIWLTWMFYTYLNMVHVVLRLIARGQQS